MELTVFNRAFRQVSRVGLDRVDRPAARYVQGSNQDLIIAVLSGLSFEVIFLVADAARLWPAALVGAVLIAVWLGCFALNATGKAHLSAVIELLAPLAAFTVLTWLLSYRAGFLVPMLMTASGAVPSGSWSRPTPSHVPCTKPLTRWASSPAGASWETAVRMADALLYDAKEAGRNCMRSADLRRDA